VSVLERGLVQVYTGQGKGKTTAALGTVLRASGQGLRVKVLFFLKGNAEVGEMKALTRLPNVSTQQFGSGRFIQPDTITKEDQQLAREALKAAQEAVTGSQYDLVVLDEVNLAVAWKLVDVKDVLCLIETKPPTVELILTGRDADPQLVQAADLVTEMLAIKHPFERGIRARKGIEY